MERTECKNSLHAWKHLYYICEYFVYHMRCCKLSDYVSIKNSFPSGHHTYKITEVTGSHYTMITYGAAREHNEVNPSRLEDTRGRDHVWDG